MATTDIVGSYLTADMDDFATLRLKGQIVDLLIKIDPEKYAKYARYEHGKVLHIILLKVLYGRMKSDLLWYHFFTSTLKDDGFILNPYDLCVANN